MLLPLCPCHPLIKLSLRAEPRMDKNVHQMKSESPWFQLIFWKTMFGDVNSIQRGHLKNTTEKIAFCVL